MLVFSRDGIVAKIHGTISRVLLMEMPKAHTVIAKLDSTASVWHWVIWAMLFCLALILRVHAFQGYSDSDPRVYAMLANDLARGGSPWGDGSSNVFSLRFGVYVPTAILIRYFGLSELALVFYPFVLSLLGCVLAYFFAKAFYRPFAGLVAMAIVAMLPFDVLNASLTYPDHIAAFWANLGVYVLYLAFREKTSPPSAQLVAGGFLFGIAWLCKESVIYLAPFVLLLALQGRDCKARVRSLCLVVLGALVIGGAELIAYKLLRGDLLFRLHVIESNYAQNAIWFFDQSSPYFGWREGGYADALINRLLISGPVNILSFFSFLPGLALMASVIAAVRRKPAWWLAVTWFASLFLMFNFMSSSLHGYRPLPLFERYLTLLLLPSVILVSGVIADIDRFANMPALKKTANGCAAAVFLALLFYCAHGLYARTGERPQLLAREIAVFLRPEDTVYSDYRTVSSLVFFRDGTLDSANEHTIPYESVRSADMAPGAYVLVDINMSRFLANSYKYKLPAFVIHPPENWEIVSSRMDFYLFRVVSGGVRQKDGRE